MRTVGPRVAALLATFLAVIALGTAPAFADRFIETVYEVPTTYTTVPTGYSYVAPSSYSYVYPSSYVATGATYLPASYATTAYTYLPTSYAVAPTYYATTYRRPGLLRRMANRPVIETTRSYAYDVTPTTYYLPTTIAYESPVTRTAYATGYECAESPVPFNPPAPAAPANPSGASKSIQSRSKDEADPGLVDPNAATQKKSAAARDATKASPPVVEPPAPEKDAAGGPLDPGNDPPKTNGPGETQDRTSFRPAFTDLRPRDNASAVPMLRGTVVSGVTGQARAGLEVVFSDQRGTYADKTKKTDSKGAFEVFLPNGTWSIRVVDPTAAAGAKPLQYGQITATSGRYLDENDSPIVGLRLNY